MYKCERFFQRWI